MTTTELNFDYLRENAVERDQLPPPTLELDHLDTLWLQVTGTLCNLACLHCFISCGPKNDSHDMMELKTVKKAVRDGANEGVKDYYFTGGEPFMHDDIREMISYTLEYGPLTVLTNGILIDEETAEWCAKTFEESRYNFDLRVSLDGTTPEENDAIRGRRTFEKIIASIEQLYEKGLNPVITVTTCHAGSGGKAGRRRFYDFVRSRGISQPRLKFIAPFKIGREERRAGGYEDWERLKEGDLVDGEKEQLQCSSCRMVTAKGVYPCPILIEEDDALMGEELADGLQDIELRHQACYTCHVEGVSCAT
jgi:sulfatase maturation enzyme AslB (radical SAM superfamily)